MFFYLTGITFNIGTAVKLYQIQV